MSHPFFINCGPFSLREILDTLEIKTKINKDEIVKDIKDLFDAEKDCITFFHSKKYIEIGSKILNQMEET